MKEFETMKEKLKMNDGLGRLALITLALFGLAGAAVAATGTSPKFKFSLKEDGVRQSAGDEILTYSNLWDGDANATVTISQDGAPIAEGLTGASTYVWDVAHNGTYVLTHTTYTNGVAGKVETATFAVSGKAEPFAPGDVTVTSYSNKYDGAAHGIAVASEIAGVAYKYAYGSLGTTSPTSDWSIEAPTLTDAGEMKVWCELSAPGYITETNSATVTITKREVTLTSGSASKEYDGTALGCDDAIVVGGDGFIDGEGVDCDFTGSQTMVGTSPNTFTYTFNGGAKAANYAITMVNGTLEVTKPAASGFYIYSVKQRYPWNGLVDFSFVFSGMDGMKYDIAFSAKDMTVGTNITMATVYKEDGSVANMDKEQLTPGTYNWVWNAAADLPKDWKCDRVTVTGTTLDARNKVQLWSGGPYWAETNIGAEKSWDYGYYFWWGDTIGYKRVNDKWVANDGSSTDFQFYNDFITQQTDGKSSDTLQSEGWITEDDILMPEHDAAHVQWGGSWRIPTYQEMCNLVDNCDWTWTTLNGVKGYVVRGRGDYASASIFLPAAGFGFGDRLDDANSYGGYWTSLCRFVPTYQSNSSSLYFYGYDNSGGNQYMVSLSRRYGRSIRPVQSAQ